MPGNHVMSDSGKQEFRAQAMRDTPDYGVAYRILKSQVSQYPENAELRYFLGYTIDRLNSSDGSGMHNLNREMTIRASEQLEMVNKLEPKYLGEQILLDPYCKIASIWGSLAEAYLNRGAVDSARWAFAEGKKRGGFIEPVLDYNRQLLNSCDSNAILVTIGDNITIPIWYLQMIENFRTDVTIVDASLINASWYTKYLKARQRINIELSDEQIDTISYLKWTPQTIKIISPLDTMEELSWELRPTYLDRYILKGDRILLHILNKNLFHRPIYFVSNSDSSYNLFLDSYLQKEGVVSRLVANPGKVAFISQNYSRYNIDKLKAEDIQKSKDAVTVLNGFRLAYALLAVDLLNDDEEEKAKEILFQLKHKFGKAKLPVVPEGFEKYLTDLFLQYQVK